MAKHQVNRSARVNSLRQRFPEIQPRYERKFRLPINFSETMKSRLASFGFYRTFPDRCVNSQYFDTSDLDFGRENIDGDRFRLKARMRWYEDANDHSLGKLEIKCKDGALGYKYRFNLDTYESEKIVGVIQRETGLLLQAKCVIRYSRAYYENSLGIRATIDENLLATNNNLISGTFSPLNYSVLELKYSRHLDEVYRRLIQPELFKLIAIRLNKSSKYVEGLHTLELI